MRVAVVIILVLTAIQLVSSQNLSPRGPFRAFQGDFRDYGKVITGNVRVDIDDEITNITTLNEVANGSVTIRFQGGGVGYNHVAFSYQVTEHAEGFYDVYIITSDPTNITDLIETRTPYFDYPPFFLFKYNATYNSTDPSRQDRASFQFDKDIHECKGFSTWYNGNGSRDVIDTLVLNYIFVTLKIPGGVYGSSAYYCYYSDDAVDTRDVSLTQSLNSAVDDYKIGLLQTHDTYFYLPRPANVSGDITLGHGYEILSYEGSFLWQNGSGEVILVGGGVGYNYMDFLIKYLEDYSYGFMEYDIVFKAS